MQKYTGGCHCGKVRFEVEMEIGKPIACNCSICGKRGSLLSFAPADHFKLLSGRDFLKDYQFGKKSIHHLFCKECGVSSFAEGAKPTGEKVLAVNIRCLDDIDPLKFNIVHFDGKSL